MLECLLTARWPSRTPRLSLPPLHVRSAAWSATGLIAFTSTDPDSPEDTEDGFPIYIRAAGRPGDIAVIKTQHKASISFLEWSGSGHALLSVDQCGECRLWEMKENMSNEWTCTYRLWLGGSACVAVQWLATTAETCVREGAGSAYDSKYPRTRPPGPQATAASLACVLVTADASLHVLYQNPSDRSFAHYTTPLWLAGEGLTTAAIGLYADGEALVACAHKGSEHFVSVNEVQITLGAHCKATVRGVATMPVSKVSLLCFDNTTRDLFTYSQGLLQRFHPRVTTVTANTEIFGPNSETMRKSEYHGTVQISCAGNVCAMTMSPSGAYLAMLHADGVCELYSAQTLERLAASQRPTEGVSLTTLLQGDTGDATRTLWWSLAFSPNNACVALTNAHGDMMILDCLGSARDEAETLANGFELSMVRRCDWWDLLLCLHARGSEALCQRVVQQLEQRFQEQKPATQQMYLASSLSLCTSIYRLQRDACSMIDANIRLLLETCVSAFRACVSPSPPQAAFSSAKLRSSLEDDASVDEIVAKISIPEKQLDGLQPLAQWAVNCAVFLLRSIEHLVTCYPSLKLTRQTLPSFTAKSSIPGVAMLFDVGVISELRELLVYALYVRMHKDESKQPGGAKKKSGHIHLLLKLLGELRAGLSFNVFDPNGSHGPTVTCQKLQEIMAKCPEWENSFRHPSFDLRTLLTRLNVLPDRPPVYGPLLPSGSAELRTEEAVRKAAGKTQQGTANAIQFDVIRHVPISHSHTTRARQCVRCRRLSHATAQPMDAALSWARKWDSACVCGGLWRSYSQHT